MIRFTLIAAALALAPLPGAALDLDAMTEAERTSFGAAVRDYLLANPDVLMEAFGILEDRQAAEAEEVDRALVAAHAGALFDDGNSYVGGNPDGDVTIVEFIDYRCSYCRRAHPEVAQLLDGDGEIRKIVKEFPILGPESVEASRFAISALQNAGPDAYRSIGDTLIAHRGTFDRATFSRIARDAGFDGDAIVAGMDDNAVTEVIRRNHRLAQDLSITGTPTFVFGDRMLRGYVPLDDMRDVVADIRAR